MNIRFLIVSATFGLAPLCFSASDESLTGRRAEERSCTPCHSLRLVDSQRLSRTAWSKELDKMIGWGGSAGPSAAARLPIFRIQRSETHSLSGFVC